MHTQHDTAQVILGQGADYVMTVKANMPTLYRQLKKLPWAAIPAVSSVSTDHGRRARRTIKVALAPAWIGFDGAAQVAQLRRTVTRNGKKTVEVVYLITSRPPTPPRRTWAAWSASTGPSRIAQQTAPMSSQRVDQGSIIGREGLLRLVEVVERLRARECGRDVSSWTREGAAAPNPGAGDGSAVGGPAGGQSAGGGALARGDGGQGGACGESGIGSGSARRCGR